MFGLGGGVGLFGLGLMLGGGEVAALVANFAVGRFAGPRAGAVISRGRQTCGRLRPMFRLFHVPTMTRDAERVRGDFTPWPPQARGAMVCLL